MSWSLRQVSNRLNQIGLPLPPSHEIITAVRIIVDGEIREIKGIQHDQYVDNDMTVNVVHITTEPKKD